MFSSGRRGARVTAVLLLALVLCVGGASMAFAQTDPYSNDKPIVKPSLITRDADPEPPSVDPAPPTVLPFTGGDVTAFLIVGLMAISAGTLIVHRTRHTGDRS